jgi:hypothetical protein
MKLRCSSSKSKVLNTKVTTDKAEATVNSRLSPSKSGFIPSELWFVLMPVDGFLALSVHGGGGAGDLQQLTQLTEQLPFGGSRFK